MMNESERSLVKAIKKAPLTPTKKKKKKKRSSVSDSLPRPQDVQTDGILDEMKGLGLGGSLAIAFGDPTSGELCVVKPIEPFPLARELRWTSQLPLFEEAKQSAINAVLRLTAQTQALRCSFNAESPHIEQTLFQIRTGLIPLDDPRIPLLVSYAQEIGKGRTIHGRIDDAMHDSERRKNSGKALPDLNAFRRNLAFFWTGLLFWLMSDDKIATFMAAHTLAPEGFICSRSTVTRARNDLGLIKSKRPLVKGVGKNYRWFFVHGYPPTVE